MTDPNNSKGVELLKWAGMILVSAGVAWGTMQANITNADKKQTDDIERLESLINSVKEDIIERITNNQLNIVGQNGEQNKRLDFQFSAMKESIDRLYEWKRDVERTLFFKPSSLMSEVSPVYASMTILAAQVAGTLDVVPDVKPEHEFFVRELDAAAAHIERLAKMLEDKTLSVDRKNELTDRLWDWQLYQQDRITAQSWCELNEATRTECRAKASQNLEQK